MSAKEYYKTICDSWQFMKSFLPVQSEGEYWARMVDQTRAFASEHGETEFAKDLIMAIVKELDRVGMANNAS